MRKKSQISLFSIIIIFILIVALPGCSKKSEDKFVNRNLDYKEEYYTINEKGALVINENAFPKEIGGYLFHSSDDSYGPPTSFALNYLHKKSGNSMVFILGKFDENTRIQMEKELKGSNGKMISYNRNTILYYEDAEMPYIWLPKNNFDIVQLISVKPGGYNYLIHEEGGEDEKALLDWYLNEFPVDEEKMKSILD